MEFWHHFHMKHNIKFYWSQKEYFFFQLLRLNGSPWRNCHQTTWKGLGLVKIDHPMQKLRLYSFVFHFSSYGVRIQMTNICHMFQPNHFRQLVNTIVKQKICGIYTISEMPYSDKLSGLRRVYVWIGLAVCVIDLLAPVAVFFMRLGFQGRGLMILAGQQI